MESARVSSDDDKYCIARRHAIFIVAAERYGRREEIYPCHLEIPIQRLGVARYRGSEKGLAKLYILCILWAARKILC